MKRCTKCEIETPFSKFNKCKGSPDGLRWECRDCQRKYQQNSYLINQKKEMAYYQNNKEKIKGDNKTDKGKQIHKKACEKHIQNYPERHKARTATGHAIRDEKLTRPSHCEDCGEEKFVHGHHDDYLKQLEVNWLCINCHVELHRKLLLV